MPAEAELQADESGFDLMSSTGVAGPSSVAVAGPIAPVVTIVTLAALAAVAASGAVAVALRAH